MLVAVASQHGTAIDQHFGHATAFHVYRLQDGRVTYVETRPVDHYCHGQHGDQGALARILSTIGDCEAVFVARIGDAPAEKLARRGIRAVADYAWEAVSEALADYAAHMRTKAE